MTRRSSSTAFGSITNLTDNQTLPDLLELMIRFPICRTNEMGIMYFAFLRQVWRPLEMNRPSGLPLIDWTERGTRPREVPLG